MASFAASEDADPPDSASAPSEASASLMGSVTSVKVAVRVRPLIGMETTAGCQECIFGDSDRSQVVAGDTSRCFRFDHVFGVGSTQEEVYRLTTLPLVERCMDGFNATVLAYGQTGSGKTWTVGNAYTVNGAAEDAGIIPRAVTDIFQRVDELRAQGAKTSVHASFLEVINEEIKDLIGSGHGSATGEGGGGGGSKDGAEGEGIVHGGLPLRENVKGEVTVAGLSQHEIDGAQALGSLLERGALCRATASTNMNAHSSRSHAICTLSFETVRPATDEKEETVTSSQFHIVDLAGSERVKKTGAEGRRLREGININKGLLALGNVISSLSDSAEAAAGGGGGGGHHVHVPYRDSKLTRLLQSSLGGNSHTVMIACVSPADSNMAESVSTLRYAGRAMNIKNTAVKNEDVSGPPVSFAEVMALRKEVRVLQVELVQARMSGLSGFGMGGMGELGGGRGAGGAAAAAAEEEAAELRRGQAALERRVLDATRHATKAVEGEMLARAESDRWRLRCEQISAVLKDAAPDAFAGVPSWATGEASDEERSSEERVTQGSPGGEGAVVGGVGPAGSLARELRKKVFELEGQVHDLEGKVVEAEEARLAAAEHGGGGGVGGGGNGIGSYSSRRGASSADRGSTESTTKDECSFSSLDTSGGMFSGDADGDADDVDGDDGAGDSEEILRVDKEIENKERELLLKAEQARAYEAMKGQFEGLLGRLQGEVCSLQSERDGLLHKLSKSAATGGGSGGSGAAGDGKGGGALLAKMKARVAELESRIKDNRKKVAEHQRAERERAAAAKEAERLRAEVAEAKQRRAELQRTHREASSRFMKETRQHQLKDARMRRDKERMQWQVKKLQESQERTQAALKRKMEEHSIAIRKMRKLQSQRPQGGPGAGSRSNERDVSVKEAKKAELGAWLATEIEEATAVQRAKRALKTQLKLRGETARRAQKLRVDRELAGVALATGSGVEGGDKGAGEESRDREEEIEELEGSVASASKVIQSLQAFLVSAERNSSATGSRLPTAASAAAAGGGGGGAGNARWSRLRTPWDNKTALSLLLGEAVKFKVLGMSYAEEASAKDMELRSLSREVFSLRSAASSDDGGGSGTGGRASAVVAAVEAAATEVMAAVGKGEGKGSEEENGKGGGGGGGGGGGYERNERSFIVISDTEDEDDEEEEELDEDEDEEWLPDTAAASKKRPTSTGRSVEGRGSVNGRGDITDGARSKAGRSSGGGVGASDRSSSGSAVSTDSGKSVWSVASSSDNGGEARGEGPALDWEKLESFTVVHLKGFLRQLGLQVSGKKDVLIDRLRASREDDTTSSPASASTLASTSVSPSASSETDSIADDSYCPTSGSRGGSAAEGGGTAEVDGGGGGVVKQGSTLRERLEARVRDREATREAEALSSQRANDAAGLSNSGGGGSGSSSGSGDGAGRGSSGGGGGTENENGGDRVKKRQQGRPAVDDDRSSAKQAKKSLGSSLKSGAKVGGVGAKAVMGAPISRRPLGALGQGNTRIGSNGSGSSRDGSETKGVKTLNPKAVRTTVVTAPKQAGGSGGGSSSSASAQRKVGPAPSTSATTGGGGGGGGVKRPRPAVRPGTVVDAVPVVRNGKNERPRNFHDSSAGGTGSGSSGSGSGGGLRNGSVGVKSSGAVAVASSNHAKRVKIEGSAKPATKTPSFLKPTKSSGAHVSAGSHARSGGGGGGSGAGDAQ